MTSCRPEKSVPNALSNCSKELNKTAAYQPVTKNTPLSSAHSGSTYSSTKITCGGLSKSSDLEELRFDASEKLRISEPQSETEVTSKLGDSKEHLGCSNQSASHIPDQTDQPALVDPFDICPPPKGSGTVVLKPSLLVKNRERRNETKRSMDTLSGSITILRPGMVLLKGYISLNDQVPHMFSFICFHNYMYFLLLSFMNFFNTFVCTCRSK